MAGRIRTAFLIFVFGFLVLFLLRLGYGYLTQPNGVEVRRYGLGDTGNYSNQARVSQFSFASSLKNYASTKFKKVASAPSAIQHQKYEKIANVALKTREFDKDETQIRGLIKKEQGLIQFEQRDGLKGSRLMRLAIGVNPTRFDGFVNKVKTLGTLTALTINKTDKTNEYRKLKAKRTSLEKTRAALIGLKERSSEIKDGLQLEQQMLELEQQIQALGVSLGDFDSENEFVTVKLLLAETPKAILRNISLVQRTLVAFTWSAKYYALLCLALAALLISALVATLLLRLLTTMISTSEAPKQK